MEESTSTRKPPVETLRDGVLKATIWANEVESGVIYNTTFTRSYVDNDEGDWHDTISFGVNNLLALAKLAAQAHSRVRFLMQQDRNAAREAEAGSESKSSETNSQEGDNPFDKDEPARATRARALQR